MRRFLAVVVIFGSLSATAFATTMRSMSMDGGTGMTMTCTGPSCAAAPSPAMPLRDCLDHCLSSAQAVPAAASPAAAGVVLLCAMLAAATVRIIAPPSVPRGAPPHLGSSLRALALAGVIMRN